MEAYQASVVPPEPDKGTMDCRTRPKVASAYAVDGEEQISPVKDDDVALIHKRLSELQAECTSTREEIGRVKAQKDEAEKKAAQAAQAAKAAAQAAKTASPPASSGSAPSPDNGNNGYYRPPGNYRGRGRGRGNQQVRADDVCHKCGLQGHWARQCPNGSPPEQSPTPPAPAVTKVVDYKPERGWVGAEFWDKPIGEEFLRGSPWDRGIHKQYDTIVNGEPVHIIGQTMIVFRLASGDCRAMMAAQVDVTPDLDGLVLGMEWMHENTCMWNIKTGRVRAIDDIVFHAEYDRDASLVKRVTPLPDDAARVGFVSVMEPERPETLEQLLPIRVSGIRELELEVPRAMSMVQNRLGFENELADPESSMSDATSSPSESDYEDEAESESSDRDRGGSEQSHPPRESTLVMVPVAQFEQMDDSDDPAPAPADPIPEPMVVVPYDPDIIVEQVEEVELEPELASSDEQEQSKPLHELSQGNAMAASATPVDPDRDDMFTREELVAAQQAEEAIRVTVEYCKKGKPPDRDEIRTIPEEAKDMLLQFETSVVKNDLLYRRYVHGDGSTKHLQLILPTKMRREYIERIHTDLGHFGQAKTCEAVARRTYFPGWRPYTKLIVRNCTVCNKSHRGGRMPRQTALRPMREFRPMSVLHADLVGPIPVGSNGKGQYGFQYILSVIDSAMRYLWLIPLRNKTAETVANALYEDVIARTSVPSAILTDLGKEFMAEILDRLYARLGITRLRTSGYHPQSDSKCERVHCSVHDMLVKFIERDHKNWAAYLSGICFAYNSSIHTATGYAPHELFYSFPPTCPFDVVVKVEQTEAVNSADQYALEATDRLKQAFQFVYEYSGHVADHMKSNYDAAIKPRHFEVGSFVLVYTPPKQQSHVYGKWKVAWQGPFRVTKRLNATNYIVKRSHKAKDFIVHGDCLRDYFGEVDNTAWPHAKGSSQQPTASGPDNSAGDPDPAAEVADSRTHNTAPATQPPAQDDSSLTRGRRLGHNPAGQTSGRPANSNIGSSGDPVSMSPGIHYVNEQSSEPIDDAGFPTRPSRVRRRPARHLSAISVRGAAADEEGGRRHLGKFVGLENKQLSCEELMDYTVANCNQTLSVGVDRTMPDKRQRKQQKRRHRSSDSSDSESNQRGRRRPSQQRPRVPFEIMWTVRTCGSAYPICDKV